MAFSRVCVVLLALAGLALAYPAREDKDLDHEVEIIPLENQRPGLPTYFEDADYDPEDSGYFPFVPITRSIAGYFNRLFQDFSEMFGQIPTRSNSTLTPFGFPNIQDIDLSKGNTTSVVKVIDGHKVEINETEFKKDTENGGSYYKVRLINVLPDKAEGENVPETVPSTPRDVETVENSKENEIPSQEGSVYDNIETFDEVARFPVNRETEWNELDSVESFGDNNLDYNVKEFRDLRDDVYVNRVLAERGQPINPDAEFLDSQEFEKFT